MFKTTSETTNIASNPTIAMLLRDKDLELKKINKDAKSIVGVMDVVDQSKLPKELSQTGPTMQSIYDKLGHVTTVLSKIRKGNVSTITDSKNFFTQDNMNVVDCRQNISGNETVGSRSEVYYLKQLYNHAVRQSNDVKSNIEAHNKSMRGKLERDLKSEDHNHEEERRKLKDRKITIREDFESSYLTKVELMTSTFWKENKAVPVDPIDIFSFLAELKSWLDDYEKNREMRLNRSNHGEIGTFTPFDIAGTQTVSLEELMSSVKDYDSKIEYAFNGLFLVSWQVGSQDAKSHDIIHAKQRLSEMKTLIKTYGEMQSVQKYVTCSTNIGLQNPITNNNMTAIDVVDFKNIVVPVFTNIINRIESQKNDVSLLIKQREPECRNKAMDLLKDSMGTASGRPSPEQIKEITKSAMDSTLPVLTMGEGLENWLKKYQNIIDFVESTMDTSLATVNANTRVPVTWTTVIDTPVVGSWDDSTKMSSVEQYHVTPSSSGKCGKGGKGKKCGYTPDNFAPPIAGGWN
jgi:hypothetical protein